VSTLWPRVSALASTLPARQWLLLAGFAVSALTALAACGVAALLFLKVPDRQDARALTLFLCFLAFFWGSLFRFMQVGTAAQSFSINLTFGSGWVSQAAIASFLLAAAAFLRFSALFPEPLTAERLPSSRMPRALHRLRAAFLRAGPVWGTAMGLYVLQRYLPLVVMRAVGANQENPPAFAQRIFVGAMVAAAALLVIAALSAMTLGMLNLRASYRLARPAERRRMQWVIGGFTVAAWMVLGAAGLIVLIVTTDVGSDVLGAAIQLALVLAPLVLVLGAAVGILYSGAIDPALALRRSTLYAMLGAIAIVAYAGLENGLSNVLEQRLALPGFVGAMLAGAIVTVALIPLRGGVKRWMDRRAAAATSHGAGNGTTESIAEDAGTP
jgi:hypothetical protein